MSYPDRVLLNLLLQQIRNSYLLDARKRWARANCIERKGIWPVLKTCNGQRVSPSKPRRMGFPFGTFPTKVGMRGGAQGQRKTNSTHGVLNKNKNKKRNLSESGSKIEAAELLRFVVIESFEVYLVKLSPFLVEKVRKKKRANQKIVRKTRSGNLLVVVNSRRQRKNIKTENHSYDEMQSLPAWKTQHFQKRGIRSRELALAREEIPAALRKQWVTNISLHWKRRRTNPDNTYILKFNQPHTPKEVKIGYCPESWAVCSNDPEML